MKNMIIAALMLFQTNVFANEVAEVNGVKVVLIQPETAQKLDAIFRSQQSEQRKAVMIAETFKAETVSSANQPNFCTTAEVVYGKDGQKSQDFYKKCVDILTSQDMIDDLSSGSIDYKSVEELRTAVSQFFALFFLMF